tara:strand:- start:164 stop:418 length:255 start_codon:yes stop_codon:yes gene_type:complete
MQTIYQIVEEVCARDFPILARLSETQQKKFIDIIYEDVLAGDNPTEIAEHELYDYIEEFIIKAISVSIDDVVDFMDYNDEEKQR